MKRKCLYNVCSNKERFYTVSTTTGTTQPKQLYSILITISLWYTEEEEELLLSLLSNHCNRWSLGYCIPNSAHIAHSLSPTLTSKRGRTTIFYRISVYHKRNNQHIGLWLSFIIIIIHLISITQPTSYLYFLVYLIATDVTREPEFLGHRTTTGYPAYNL